MSKIFIWTFPEVGLSKAERENHKSYARAPSGIHSIQSKPLAKAELKFLDAWSAERQIGRRAFYRKNTLRSCLAVSIVSGIFLFLKVAGLIDSKTTFYSAGTMLAIAVNIIPAFPSWKKNEARYEELLRRIDEQDK